MDYKIQTNKKYNISNKSSQKIDKFLIFTIYIFSFVYLNLILSNI